MSELSAILRLFHLPGKQATLPKTIKLNFRDIRSIGTVDQLYHQVEDLSLNHNLLTNLQGIE